jgi:hypothetical protein
LARDAGAAPDAGALPSGACDAPPSLDDEVVTGNQEWSQTSRVVRGVIRVKGDGVLALNHVTLQFDVAVEGTTAICLADRARLNAVDSILQGASTRRWVLLAHDRSQVTLVRTRADGHAGLRLGGRTTFLAEGHNVGVVHVGEESSVTIRNGANARLALLLAGEAAQTFDNVLLPGWASYRSVEVNTSRTGRARVTVESAAVDGWTVHLSDVATATVRGAPALTLAMHLRDVSSVVTADVTSSVPRTDTVDFGLGGPGCQYADTVLENLDLHLGGASEVTLEGATSVVEAQVSGSSVLTLGSRARVAADLAVARDQGRLVLNGSTLQRGPGPQAPPSFTAQDRGAIEINDVTATNGTRVYAVGAGQVRVNGGSQWSLDMMEAVETTGAGGIYVDGGRVLPRP